MIDIVAMGPVVDGDLHFGAADEDGIRRAVALGDQRMTRLEMLVEVVMDNLPTVYAWRPSGFDWPEPA